MLFLNIWVKNNTFFPIEHNIFYSKKYLKYFGTVAFDVKGPFLLEILLPK